MVTLSPLSPQELADLLRRLGYIFDGGDVLDAATTSGDKAAAVAALTALCQDAAGSLAAWPLADAAGGTVEAPPLSYFLVLLTAAVQQAASQGAENACTGVSTDLINGLTSALSSLGTLINGQDASFSLTSDQSTDFTNLNSYANSGDLAGAIAAANQFLADSSFVGTTNSNGSITYTQDIDDQASSITVTPDWAPEAFVSASSNAYYFVQPDDIGDTSSDTWDNIATEIGDLNSFSISGSELARLENAIGGDSSDGGLVYVPTGDVSITSTPNNLSSLPNGQAYIYDSGNSTAYSIASSLDGATAGGLYTLNSDGSPGAYFAPGTWSDVYNDPDSDPTGDPTTDYPGWEGGPSPGRLTLGPGGGGTLSGNGGGGGGGSGTFDPDGGPIYSVPDPNGGYDVFQIGGPAFYLSPDGTVSSIDGGFPFPDGNPLTDGPQTGGLSSAFNRFQNTDPIVLDLSGDDAGVQLTPLADSSAYFDLHNTGFAVNTGWVGPSTGILVNTTDPTNITDLFGNSDTSGFAALKALDVYDTGVLNSSDPGWSSLYVWVDANGNGTVDSGEVQSLADLGITSINLNSTEVNETVNGNVIGSVATFTYTDDTTGQVAEAFFDNSTLDSTFGGSYTLNPAVLTLPDLRGYGTMPDLYIAMSMDTTLLGQVQNLASDSLSDAATFDQQVTNILYEWAGVEAVDPTSRGDYVNAQDLGTLEAVTGESYVSYNGIDGDTNPPFSDLGAELESTWNGLFMAEKERILAQGPLASYLSGITYDYDTDSLTGTTDLSTLATAVGDNVPSDPATALQYLASMGQFMDQLASDLSISTSDYDTALASDFAAAGLPMSSTSVDDLHYLTPTYDGSGDATFSIDPEGAIANGITGFTNILDTGGYNLTQDVIANIQTLDTGDTGVTLTAAELAGFTTLSGGGTLYAGSAGTYDLATETVSGSYNLDAAGFAGDVTLIGNNQNGQYLTAGSGTDTLTGGNGNGDTLTAGSGTDTLTAGNGTGDTLNAGGGTDTLIAGSGGDTLNDGEGVDTLEGGSGNDTFNIYDATSGSTITGGGGTDTLVAGVADLTGITFSGINTLDAYAVDLTLTQFNSFDTIDNISGGTTGSGAIHAETGESGIQHV